MDDKEIREQARQLVDEATPTTPLGKNSVDVWLWSSKWITRAVEVLREVARDRERTSD